ncbi:uncharacterized protein LOC103511713 [Diaphorina citri]|uniref:Uncharacterized protein LOC103511713 n=1 Tax=Diaphorina citri TaxID=121845 RepID=A0A3Q0IYB8_DIACI|nr:uncharacterized protein LOC103511713 [Diaphorina citri]
MNVHQLPTVRRLRLEIPEIIELHHLQHGPTFEQVTEYVDKHQSVNHASDSWFETSTTSETELNEDEGCPYNLWKKGGFGNFFKVLMTSTTSETELNGDEGCPYNLWKKGGFGNFFKVLMTSTTSQTELNEDEGCPAPYQPVTEPIICMLQFFDPAGNRTRDARVQVERSDHYTIGADKIYESYRLRLEIPEIIELHHLQHGPTFEQVTEYVDKHQSVNHASDSWFETSTTSETELNGDEGCLYNLWKKGGFGNFFKVLMRQVSGQTPVDLSNKILYKKEVNKIDWEYQNGAAVSCSDGSVYTAYKIIITVPLGVLKSKLITFVPSLPAQKLNAIEGLNFGTVDKIFIRFPAKWWKDGCQGFNFYWTQQDKMDLFKDMVHVDGKPWVWGILGFYMDAEDPLTLLGWIAGPTARYMETLPMAVLQADIMRLFRHFLGGAYIIPEPIRIVRSAWSINPHFRGSYSSRSVTTDRLNTSAADLAAPVINREGRPVLLFAGEATSPHHYGTVNGAVESGARETANAIVYLRREGFFEKLVNIAVKELEHKGNQVGRILNLFGGGI